MEQKFRKAIVRTPCPEIVNGLSSAADSKPDYQKALEQHRIYVAMLEKCGLDVTVLDAVNTYPDSTFIEDVALCTSRCAIITNPGAPSRNGEKDSMKPVLQKFFTAIETIQSPGTLEAGDVMMVDDHFYIGISERTNQNGAEQLMTILRNYRMSGSTIPLKHMLHLKSGLSYLEQNTLLVSGKFLENPKFKNFKRIVVDPSEAYAANSLWINGRVLVPRGYPVTKKKIENAGYATMEIDVSEFQKLDGGLSCLSLRF